MANIKDLIKSIEAADSSFDEKLAAINQMEETLVAMRQQEEQAVQDNVDLIVEAIKVMERKVESQLEIAKSIVPEKGDKGDKGDRGLDGANGQDGKDGRDGINGRDGQDGQDGVSVTDAKIDFDGSLIITLSTGQEINVGEVVAPELQEKIKLVTSGGAGTVLPNQAGNSGKVLGTDGSTLSWVTGGGGGVTSVGGTGTVSGLTLSGTVTTSGNLTLGGSITGFATSGANTNLTSVALTSGTITTAPTNNTDIVNKQYADAIASGIHFHEAVDLATTAALPTNTYNNGTSGVGATLTATANGALSVDSTLTVAGNRILVKNQATQANNGVYVVTQVGTAGTPYILTRATDFNTVGTGVNQIDEGDFFLVTSGTVNVNTAWVQQTAPPITVGTTALVFQQFAAPITYTAGTGLNESPSFTFNIANTGTAGTYGTSTQIPVFVTNAQGQVTSVTNTAIGTLNQNTTGTATLAQSTSVFTTGTAQTYTAPSNTQWVKVTVVGPGGNGGTATTSRATGGSGGGVAIKWLSMTAGQTLTYTVGTASGIASTVASGTLTITTITANSGSNGTTTAYANSFTAGPTGGTATGGDVNINGGRGGNSYGSAATVATNFSGFGGNCPGFGSGGGAYGSTAVAGQNGNGYGGGGGGSHGVSSTPLGSGGIIIFEAF